MPLKPPRKDSIPTLADGDEVEKPDWSADKTIEDVEAAHLSPLIDDLVMPQNLSIDDDRPTELYERSEAARLHTTRKQVIQGSTIGEMIKSAEHRLARPLAELITKARHDLPQAEIDARSKLQIIHEFEFDRRIGYRLSLTLFDATDRCVQVSAELDQDGRAVRRGSLISKLIHI